MGHHGWKGDPPRTEDDARRRIIDVTVATVEAKGPDRTTVSDVAAALGVTRQTVYRYYPTHAELLAAVAQAGLEEFADRMAAHLATFSTPLEVAVESVVYALEVVPRDPRMGLLLQVGQPDVLLEGATSSVSFAVGADILRRTSVDWASVGIGDDELAGLAEVTMRLFLSFLQHPADPPRTPDETRAFVRRWLAPTLGG